MDELVFWMAVTKDTCLADLLVDFAVALMVVLLESEQVDMLADSTVFYWAVATVA